jgi:hypothetical protein
MHSLSERKPDTLWGITHELKCMLLEIANSKSSLIYGPFTRHMW